MYVKTHINYIQLEYKCYFASKNGVQTTVLGLYGACISFLSGLWYIKMLEAEAFLDM